MHKPEYYLYILALCDPEPVPYSRFPPYGEPNSATYFTVCINALFKILHNFNNSYTRADNV